ncbi:MAG TPA: hypothetical protein VGM91_04520 [Conexibacter sp.]|jgi:hypothetical protein
MGPRILQPPASGRELQEPISHVLMKVFGVHGLPTHWALVGRELPDRAIRCLKQRGDCVSSCRLFVADHDVVHQGAVFIRKTRERADESVSAHRTEVGDGRIELPKLQSQQLRGLGDWCGKLSLTPQLLGVCDQRCPVASCLEKTPFRLGVPSSVFGAIFSCVACCRKRLPKRAQLFIPKESEKLSALFTSGLADEIGDRLVTNDRDRCR